MYHSLPWLPMNHRAKFDTTSFILGREILKNTHKIRNKQTVTDISTPCQSACVDNKVDFLQTEKRNRFQ